MLIGISGSSGNGKTTLASLLSTKLNACLIGEVASYVAGLWKAEKGMSLAEIRAYDATRFQLEVLEEQIRREDAALQNHDVVVVDRTIYDNLFFALFYHDDINLLNRYLRLFSEREREQSYDLILYCEPLSSSNPVSSVENCILPRLIPPSIPVCHLPPVSPQERVEVAVNTIREVVKAC